MKVYGVTTLKRLPSLPNIPTVDEAGLKGFEVTVWHALYAPKGTPKPVIDSLTKALQVALKDNIVKQRFADLAPNRWPKSAPLRMRYGSIQGRRSINGRRSSRRRVSMRIKCISYCSGKGRALSRPFFCFCFGVTWYTRRDEQYKDSAIGNCNDS